MSKFFNKNMMKQQRNDLGHYFGYCKYKRSDFLTSKGESITLPLWNTNSIQDVWLAKYCKLDFIQARLREQYPDEWIGWLPYIRFDQRGSIFDLKKGDSYISPVIELDDRFRVYPDLLIYGTDYAHKLMYSAESIIRGESYLGDPTIESIRFYMFGYEFKMITDQSGSFRYYTLDGLEVSWIYSPRSFHYKYDIFYKLFLRYNIKRATKKSDYLKYKDQQIIMSGINDCITVDLYKNYSRDHFDRYIHTLPDWVLYNLK